MIEISHLLHNEKISGVISGFITRTASFQMYQRGEITREDYVSFLSQTSDLTPIDICVILESIDKKESI